MTVAKGLSSGYQPVAAAIMSPRVAEPFRDHYFQHGQTFSGHPAGCRAALVNIDIITREHLVENAADVGAYLLEGLKTLLSLPLVGDARGKGLLLAVELVSDKDKRTKFRDAAEVGFRVRDRAIELGLICRSDYDCLILAPPLILTRDQADRMVAILAQSIREVAATL
jgi:putrescine aminotransferase